jgi:hypothetical protein
MTRDGGLLARYAHQGGRDGWLPRYLAQVNEHGAPDNAMWTGLGRQHGPLLMSDYVFVLSGFPTATT